MSEEEGGQGPEAQPIPEPPPVPAGTYEDHPANVLGGIFLIGCGLCLLLVGGGCTTLLVMLLLQSRGSFDGIPMLTLSLAITAGGIFAIVYGIRMTSGRRG